MSLGRPRRFTACSRISRPAFGRGSVFCSQTKELERGAPRDKTTGDENTNASFPNAIKTEQSGEAAGLPGQGRTWNSLLLLPFPPGPLHPSLPPGRRRGCRRAWRGHILPTTFVAEGAWPSPLAPSPATAKHQDSIPWVSAVLLKNRSKLWPRESPDKWCGLPWSLLSTPHLSAG